VQIAEAMRRRRRYARDALEIGSVAGDPDMAVRWWSWQEDSQYVVSITRLLSVCPRRYALYAVCVPSHRSSSTQDIHATTDARGTCRARARQSRGARCLPIATRPRYANHVIEPYQITRRHRTNANRQRRDTVAGDGALPACSGRPAASSRSPVSATRDIALQKWFVLWEESTAQPFKPFKPN